MKRDSLLLFIYLIPFVYFKLLWESSGYSFGLLILVVLFAILAFLHNSVFYLLIGQLITYVSSEAFFSVYGLEELGIFQPYRVWEMTRVTHALISPIIVIFFFVFRMKKLLS